MALWSNTDANTSAPIFAAAQVQLAPTAANRDALYDATPTGIFGVDTNEIALANNAASKPTHTGWVLRKEGSGHRAGRIQTEVLVAMGSLTGDGTVTANDNTVYANT